jgi:hypothetical protein
VKPIDVKVSNEHRGGSVSLALVDIPVMNQAIKVASLVHKEGKKSGGKSNMDKKGIPKGNKWTDLIEMDSVLEEGDHCVSCGIVITKGRSRVEVDEGPVHIECCQCKCGKLWRQIKCKMV